MMSTAPSQRQVYVGPSPRFRQAARCNLKPLPPFDRNADFDAIAVEHLAAFGLNCAPWLIQQDRAFARQLLLLLYRKMVMEGANYSDLHHRARFLVGNRDRVRFDELTRADRLPGDFNFWFALHYYLDLHQNLPFLLAEFAQLGIDHARPKILARGAWWGKLLLLKLIDLSSEMPPERVARLGRSWIKNPDKVKDDLDFMRVCVARETGTGIGLIGGDRLRELAAKWKHDADERRRVLGEPAQPTQEGPMRKQKKQQTPKSRREADDRLRQRIADAEAGYEECSNDRPLPPLPDNPTIDEMLEFMERWDKQEAEQRAERVERRPVERRLICDPDW